MTTASPDLAPRSFLTRFADAAERAPGRVLALVIALHVVIWTALPWILCANLQLDLVDGIALGKEWQLGYWKHPPLPWWLAETARLVTGVNESVYVLGPIAVALAFWAIWRLGTQVADRRTALVAVLALEGVHYYNFSAVKFAHDQLQLPVWAFATLFFWHALTRRRTVDWVLAGALLGVAIWTKYSAAVLGLPFALFLVIDPRARATLFTRGPYIMALAMLAVATPNLIWLVTHDFLPFRYVDARAVAATHPADYLLFPAQWTGSQLLALAPALALIALAAWPAREPAAPPSPLAPEDRAFARRFLLMAGFGPFLFVTLAFGAAGRLPVAMWGYPLWNALPLALLAFAPVSGRGLRRFLPAFIVVVLLYPLAYIGTELFEPAFRDRPKATQFPGRAVAAALTEQWRARTRTPLTYVAGSEFAANNVAVYSPDHPHVVVHANPALSPWIDPADLARKGAILVWQDTADPPPDFLRHFPNAEIQPPLVLPRHTLFPVSPDTVGYAIIPPRPAP